MLRNAYPVEIGDETCDWTRERITAGERLYSGLQSEVAEAVDLAVSQAAESVRLLSSAEISGIIVHGLIETAVRQIFKTKMPCTLEQFEQAARFVYKTSCHHEEREGVPQH